MCLKKFKPHFSTFHVLGVNGTAIYDYDETLKSLIYQFKGCGDIELSPVFLERYSNELHLMYRNYKVCPAPSYIKDDEERGFNHVIEIFKFLKLDFLYIFEKTDNYKQSNQDGKHRKEISKHIRLKNNISITGKNLLIVDDILTTGSTLRTLIKLVKDYNPKNIKILVLCKGNKTDIGL